MAHGSAWPGDEKFTLAGTDYYMRFPESGGGFGLASSNPFAPKSTSGERSYQDYDVFSAVAMADLSGGMGQERLTDVTRYLTAVDVDARSGRIILGPRQSAVGGIGPNISLPTTAKFPDGGVVTAFGWYTAFIVNGQEADTPRAIAQFFHLAESRTLDRIWLPIRLDTFFAGDSINLTIIESASDEPTGPTVGVASVLASAVSTTGAWTEFIFASPITLSAGDYWIKLASGSFTVFSWLGEEYSGGNTNVKYYNINTAWLASTTFVDMMFWYEPIAVYPDRPVHFFNGTGKDNTKRVWLWSGHYLYYLNGYTPTAARTRNTAPVTDMLVPGTVTTSKQAGGNCQAGVYKIKVAARNSLGSTVATAGSNVTTEGKNLTVRIAFAAVTNATHYDIYCSTDSDPLLVGSITEALRASGIKITAQGITGAGSIAGAVDVEVPGTGAVAAASGMTVPGTLTTSKQAGGACQAGVYKVKVAAGNTDGNTSATAGNDVTTETSNLTVRVAFAAVTSATYYDIYCSTDTDPLLVGRITEAQRASGIKLTAVGVTGSGGTAGAVDIEVPGTGAVAVVVGTSAKRLPGDITTAVFWAGSADAEIAHIYLGMGPGNAIAKYDADVVGGGFWETTTGATDHADLLAVHDHKLWRVVNKNELSASLDGNTFGVAIKVGDKAYTIRNLLSWNGDLYIGKDDGLYKIVSDALSAYPTAGDPPICIRVLNLESQVDATNFRLMVEYQNDLWFSAGTGLLKLTTGNVLSSVAPELELGYTQSNRVSYTAAFSALNTLWVAAEANIDGSVPTSTDVSASSYVLALFEGKWHPVATLARPSDMIRSIIIDGGLREGVPRLWYGAGLAMVYAEMPTTLTKRWLSEGVTFAERGILYTSWLDGNIRTIEKDWVTVELDCANMTHAEYVKVWWRATEATAWELVGTITTEGISRLSFPAGSHSARCQLAIELHRHHADTTDTQNSPQVLAIVVKYLERPRDARGFTRTYELGTRPYWRTGAPVALSLAEQVRQLETLRESSEPLTWENWFGLTYQVHIIGYNGTELPERQGDLQDEGSITVVVSLQEIETV